MASLSVMTWRLPWSGKLTPGCAPAAWYAIAPATTAAATATPPIPNQSAREPRPLASPALASVLPVSIVCSRVGTHGGSVWESNPPPTCLEPDAGFEVREAHRDPIRLRAAKYPSDQRKECTIGGLAARYCHLTRPNCHLTLDFRGRATTRSKRCPMPSSTAL